MAIMKAETIYHNPDEAIYHLVANKKLFNEQDFLAQSKLGLGADYLTAVANSDSINPSKFYSDYKLYYGNPENRAMAIYNETAGDKTTVKKFKLPVMENGQYLYDEKGNIVENDVEMTEYEYTKALIAQENQVYGFQSYEKQKELERIENRNFWTYLADVVSVKLNLGMGFIRATEGIVDLSGALVEELFQTVGGVFKGDLTGKSTFAETVNKWFTDYAMSDDLKNMLQQFEYKYTHWYDDTGNMVTLGRYLTGAADGIGSLLPSMIVTYLTAGAGTGLVAGAKSGSMAAKFGNFLSKSASTIGQVAFYGPNVFGSTVSELYEEQGQDISSGQIVANAAIKTALQKGVEFGLGKIMGTSGLDELIWGIKTTHNVFRFSSNNLTSNAFLKLGKNALKEGLEESLQETSDWFVNAAHHFINNDFNSTDWDWQTIGDAFMTAMIMSVVGDGAKILGTEKIDLGFAKVNKSGQFVINNDGSYDYKKLNKLQSWYFASDLESYVNTIETLSKISEEYTNLLNERSGETDALFNDVGDIDKKLGRVTSKYFAAYYEAVTSFKLLANFYGQIGKERFEKANRVLTEMRSIQEQGLLDAETVKKNSESIADAFDNLNAAYKTELAIQANKRKMDKVVNKVNKDTEPENDNERAAKEVIEKLLGSDSKVEEIGITKNGTGPVKVGPILLLPEKLLGQGAKAAIDALVNQELADKLSAKVLEKSNEYFKNEVQIVTDLYRQWIGDESVTEEDAVMNLIFNPQFFEVVLGCNEETTASYLLRLNTLVSQEKGKKTFKDELFQKRLNECKSRWIEAAFNFYSNNLEKDASLFTSKLTKEEKSEFNERISKILLLYNMGKDIVFGNAKPELIEFMNRRIDGMDVTDEIKNQLKQDIANKFKSSDDSKKRQKALDTINEWYQGAFNSLYNGEVYLPKNNSIANYAFNAFLQGRGLTLKTIFNSNYFSREDFDYLEEKGQDLSLENVVNMRISQFEELHPNMTFSYENGNIVVIVDGDVSGFELYFDVLKQEQANILKSKDFKIGDKDVERSIATDFEDTANLIKNCLRKSLIDNGAHQFLTVDDIVNHPEYLNEAVREEILNNYNSFDKISVYRYLQSTVTNETDGKKSLVVKNDGTIVMADMTKMKSILNKDNKFTEGTFSIKNFVKSKYLTGNLENVKVTFKRGGGTGYIPYEWEGDVGVIVNTIVIDLNEYSTNAEIEYALCHEFQHAVQTENRLNTGTTDRPLDFFSSKEQSVIIETVKRLEPKLFTGIKDEKIIKNIVDAYIYHGSGEFYAYGLGGYGEIGFYPVMTSYKKGNLNITFRDGTTFTSKYKKSGLNVTRDIIDQSRDILNKYYTKYNIVRSKDVMSNSSRIKRMAELIAKKNIDRSADENIELMFQQFLVDGDINDFKNSQVIGIEFEGKKYALPAVEAIEELLCSLTKNKEYVEDTVIFKIFTFSPKDINYYKYQQGRIGGEIDIGDGVLSNRRTNKIDLTKNVKTVSKQSILYEMVSLFSDEILQYAENFGDVDNSLGDMVDKYMSKIDGSFSDIPFLHEKLWELIENRSLGGYFSEYHNTTIVDDGGAGQFPVQDLFTIEKRKEMRDAIMLDSEYRTKMFDLWRVNWGWKNGDIPNTKEFLDMELPIMRIHNSGDILNDAPFVSAKIIDNDIVSLSELVYFMKREYPEKLKEFEARVEAGENLGYGINSLIDLGAVRGHLFYGTVKVKDVISITPAMTGEVFVDTKYLTNKGLPFEHSYDFDTDEIGIGIGFRFNTRLDLQSSTTKPTELNEQKEKAPADTEKVSTEAKGKIEKAEGKVVDRRPKGERGRKIDEKKYNRVRTAVGKSKNATRIVSAKDIDKEVAETHKPIKQARGGKYVYRKFVERRYYKTANGGEDYVDVFDYYEPKGERRHTLKSENETNIRYFTIKKGKSQITMSPGLRKFIIETTGHEDEVDKIIMAKIKNGTLKSEDLINYIMKVNDKETEINNYTFRLILENYFNNNSFKSHQEFYKVMEGYEPKMVALYLALKGTDFEDLLYRELDTETFEKIWNFAMSQSQFTKELNRLYMAASSGTAIGLRYFDIDDFNRGKYDKLNETIYAKEQVYNTAVHYNKDIASGAKAIIKTRKNTYKNSLSVGEGYKQSRFAKINPASADAKINKDEDAPSFLDSISKKSTMADGDADISYYITDAEVTALYDIDYGIGKTVYDTLTKKLLEMVEDADPQVKFTFTQKGLAAYEKNLRKLSDEQLITLYRQFIEGLGEDELAKLFFLAELPGFENVVIESEYTKEQKVKQTLNQVINYGSKVQGVKNRLTTLKNKYIKTKPEIRRVLQNNEDLFDENLNLKVEAYRDEKGYKSIEIIDEIAERVRTISEAAKAGAYRDQKSFNRFMKQMAKKTKQFEKLYDAITSGKKYGKGKFTNISTEDGNISFKTSNQTEIPETITKILETGLTRTGISKVQELSSYHEKFNEDGSVDKVYDDRYLKLTMKHLLDSNAELLAELSEDDAEEIIKYYVNDNVILSDVDSQVVSETIRLVVAYILGEERHSEFRHGDGFIRFNFDETLVKKAELKMQEQTHMGAVLLSNQATIIKLLQPEKIIARQMAMNLGFELDEIAKKNIDDMVTAMRRGTHASYKKAKLALESHLIAEYSEKNKQGALDKLLTWERAMMLCNPGTWVRNYMSNEIVNVGNEASSKIGEYLYKLFPKNKLEKEGQYRLNKNIKIKTESKQITVNGKREKDVKYLIENGDVNDEIINYVNDKFINTGLIDETIDGVSKYDDNISRKSSSDTLVEMMSNSIHSGIRKNYVFKFTGKYAKAGKFGNKVLQLVYKGLNDDPWIKKQAIKYFAQIIGEDFIVAKNKAESDYQKSLEKIKKTFDEKMEYAKNFPKQRESLEKQYRDEYIKKLGKLEANRHLTIEEYLKDDKTNIYGISKHTAESFTKAVNLASYDYMKSPNFINRMERSLREDIPKGFWFAYKQVFPFLASSWSWCVEGMRYTPAGLITSIYNLAKLENTIDKMDKKRDEAKSLVGGEFARYLQIRNLGKGFIGTIGFIIGGLLCGLGWAGIDDDDDEYKLIVGDVKININDVLGSQGVMLGVALTQNIFDGGKDVIDILAEATNQLFRDSIFQDFINTFRNGGFGDFITNEAPDVLSQFVPSIVKTSAKYINRRGNTYSDKKLVAALQKFWARNIPLPASIIGANTSVNPYTGQVESFWNTESVLDLFSRLGPIKVSYPSVSNNELIAIGLGINKGILTGNYEIDGDKIKLNSKELTKLNVLYGKMNNSDLTNLYNGSIKHRVKMPDGTYKELRYGQMLDEQKEAAINTIMSNNGYISKIYILTNTGKYKYYASDLEYQKLRKLGITKNVYRKTNKLNGFVKN